MNPLCGLCGGGVTPLALGVDEHLHAAAKSTAPGSRAAASSIASKWATSHERVTHAAAGAALAVHIAKGCERSKETERSYLPRFGLERLDLAENCIGDEGAKALAFCLKTPQLALVTLELSENDIGEAGAESLAESLDVNDKLRFLGLARNSAMAEHGSGARAILHAVHQQDSQVRQVSLLDAQVGGSSLNAMRLLSRFGFADAQRQAEATEHAA